MNREEVLEANIQQVSAVNLNFSASPRVSQERIDLFRNELLRYESRNGFPFALNALGLNGIGAEVGVKYGKHARHIREHWNGKLLLLVDPYKEFGEEYKDIANVSQEQHEQIFLHAKTVLAPHLKAQRALFVRHRSTEAAAIARQRIQAKEMEPFDFVYLDAQHHGKAVQEDIAAWTPLIRKGGVLAGHDFVFDPEGLINGAIFEVAPVVIEFAKQNQLPLIVTEEKFPSWFILLPEQ